MVAVFGVFATLSIQDFKQLGVGLAAALLLDATVVRLVLLPSLITLMGERAWYLPRWVPSRAAGPGRRPCDSGSSSGALPASLGPVLELGGPVTTSAPRHW